MRRDTGSVGTFDALEAVIEKDDVCILRSQLFQNVSIAGNIRLSKAHLVREEAIVEVLMQTQLGAKSLAIQDVGIAQARQRVMSAKSGEQLEGAWVRPDEPLAKGREKLRRSYV
jgi:hypothetical protein